ncbi:non-heme iron oxygenase ferredoxin subunit [Paeniglutamicibacter psychrophenolicus]|uniref:non-heme iron oxygenase ferredoxin subunit n=1 Tax=Paeniglutamicibacter psychrophenolicus TaxID=257454 RepID=UPI0027867C07|nr:non-heme iron oxygenase ferredoxin subunit [Paeniglutamicibacter psychrophenolicus]MDQ0094354.1 3-phenylpropionate/trans-cinnamate dioxygenase ferredoxin subunit [Paeniglutamicibacter psychrophenolicus]
MDTENSPGLPAVDLGGEDLLEPGTALLVPAESSGYPEDIALFRADSGAYYALDDECPHEVASLSEGWIEDDEVECPLHSSRFCLRDGKVLCLPAVRDARTHKVQVLAGRVLLHPGTAAGGN